MAKTKASKPIPSIAPGINREAFTKDLFFELGSSALSLTKSIGITSKNAIAEKSANIASPIKNPAKIAIGAFAFLPGKSKDINKSASISKTRDKSSGPLLKPKVQKYGETKAKQTDRSAAKFPSILRIAKNRQTEKTTVKTVLNIITVTKSPPNKADKE